MIGQQQRTRHEILGATERFRHLILQRQPIDRWALKLEGVLWQSNYQAPGTDVGGAYASITLRTTADFADLPNTPQGVMEDTLALAVYAAQTSTPVADRSYVPLDVIVLGPVNLGIWVGSVSNQWSLTTTLYYRPVEITDLGEWLALARESERVASDVSE